MAPTRQMAVLVSGASGLVGSAVVAHLESVGHAVFRLVRRETRRADEISWNPQAGAIAFPRNALFDAVVHLSGENIAAGRWTDAKKEAIRQSRVLSTRILVQSLRQLPRFPQVFVSASAIGFYGDRGSEVLTETSAAGAGFLPEVCQAWEQEALAASPWGAQVVLLRTGVVLARGGGALAKMLPVFKAGFGGRYGNGRQWMSWIALEDLAAIIGRALVDRQLNGPVNAVAPQPVTNARFTEALGRVLHRPALVPMPAPVLRTLFGQMADEMLLASARVMPGRLEAIGHAFRWPELEPALKAALDGAAAPAEGR
jgi:uncharacterized protein (TIGR01777 family)